MPHLSRRQLIVLVLLTLIWGLNWPVMKLGVSDIAPLTFRMLSFWLGLPLLALVLVGAASRSPCRAPGGRACCC